MFDFEATQFDATGLIKIGIGLAAGLAPVSGGKVFWSIVPAARYHYAVVATSRRILKQAAIDHAKKLSSIEQQVNQGVTGLGLDFPQY